MANCIFQNRHLSVYFSHLACFSSIVTEVQPMSPFLEPERGLTTVWVSGEMAEVTGAPTLRLVPCMHCLIKFSQKPLRQVLVLSSHFTDDNAQAYNSTRSYKQQVEKLNPGLCSCKTQNYYATQHLHHTSQEISFILQKRVQISLDTLCVSPVKINLSSTSTNVA